MLSNFENTVYFETVISMPGIYSILKKKKKFQKMPERMEEYIHTQYDIFSKINKEN